MSRKVRLWTIGGLIVGLVVGALVGSLFGSTAESPRQVLISWTVILAIAGTLFFGLWGYANEQHKRVRRPDLFQE